MIAYSVVLAGAQPETLIVSDAEHLDVEPVGSWAVFRDSVGVALLLPAQQVHSITRIDDIEPPPERQENTTPAPGR